jgi:hypothetical protein
MMSPNVPHYWKVSKGLQLSVDRNIDSTHRDANFTYLGSGMIKENTDTISLFGIPVAHAQLAAYHFRVKGQVVLTRYMQ